MKMAAKVTTKRAPLIDADWQIFRFGLFGMVLLVALFGVGWLLGDRGKTVKLVPTTPSIAHQDTEAAAQPAH